MLALHYNMRNLLWHQIYHSESGNIINSHLNTRIHRHLHDYMIMECHRPYMDRGMAVSILEGIIE